MRVCLLAVLLIVPVMLRAQGTPVPSRDLRELQAIARADSNDPVAHYNVAAVLVDKHRYDDAERSLRQAIGIDPHYAPALLLLSRVIGARATKGPIAVLFDGPRIMFVRVAKNNSEMMRFRRRAFLLDPLLELGPPNREWLPAKWAGTLRQALRAYEHAQWSEAITGFQTVIDRTVRPTDSTRVPPVALWFRARTAMRVGDYDGAIRHLQWLTALASPDSASRERIWNPFVGEELRYILAYVHQQASRWDDATRLYQELLEQNLGLDVAHSHLAEIYEAQGRWSDAIQERRRAIDANPEDPGLLFDLGSTLAYGGQYEEAEGTLVQYAGAHPRESRIYYLLGYARMRLGKSGAAREALTQYLALAPHRYGQQIADAKQRLAAIGP